MKAQRLGLASSIIVVIIFGLQTFAQGIGHDAAQNPGTIKFETPASKVTILLFTSSDLSIPADAQERLTKIAEVTERFFFKEMNRCGYPPVAKSLFQRGPDGLVQVLHVRGDMPVAGGKVVEPGNAQDVINRAINQYHLTGEGRVWWIFIYLGDRPARFQNFVGTGNPRDGGSAMVNYDTLPGEIRPDLGLAEGFNGEIFLKGTIHELGHAFGLPHVGPDVALGLGNSLMGPATEVYANRKYPAAEKVYLPESSAAMLWKHPIFSGAVMGHVSLPHVELVNYKPVFNREDNTVTISGRLAANQPAHSVVLFDDRGRPRDQYWVQSYGARIDRDGAFRIKINQPARVNGNYRILFCFENGLVTGNGRDVTFENRGDIRKSYSFGNDAFQFGN